MPVSSPPSFLLGDALSYAKLVNWPAIVGVQVLGVVGQRAYGFQKYHHRHRLRCPRVYAVASLDPTRSRDPERLGPLEREGASIEHATRVVVAVEFDPVVAERSVLNGMKRRRIQPLFDRIR